MAENAGSLGSSSSMALAGNSSMADPTTLPALSPIVSAYGGDGGGLARAVEGCGEEESMAEILVAEGYAENEHASSSRCSNSSSRVGLEAAFMEDDVVMYGLKMLKKKPQVKHQAALILKTHLALQELDGRKEELARFFLLAGQLVHVTWSC